MAASADASLGYHLTRYFTTYLSGQLNASQKTVESYRDAFKLLLTYYKDICNKRPENISLEDINKDHVLSFLDWIEDVRGCTISTRNQRLAVIRSFCRYATIEAPEHLDGLSDVLAIREKKHPVPTINFLSADEVQILLSAPDTSTKLGFRDMVLLSVLYDSAARAQGLCGITIGDIRKTDPMVVVLHGKGSKIRSVPLMSATAALVREHLSRIQPNPGIEEKDNPLFTSIRGNKMTRWGVASILKKYVGGIRKAEPGYADGSAISPHTMRHSKSVHLVQANVNLIYIRDLLGHVDVSTTEIYARADVEMKRKALEDAYEPLSPTEYPDRCSDASLIEWLDALGRNT